MKTMKNFMLKGMLLLALMCLFTQCTKEETEETLQLHGTAAFEITDAPIDDTDVRGVFVTVADVKVDGESISHFSGRQTIDLLAFQNGNTQGLGLAELDAGIYNNVHLVLDYAKDAEENAPGCYVLTADNNKHTLSGNTYTTGELLIGEGGFRVEENMVTTIVLDVDLRKAIRRQENPKTDDRYDFVTDAEMRSAVRMVNLENTANIKGTVNDLLGIAGDKIVVYAYQKGMFVMDKELHGQGESDIAFKNAVNSAAVAEDGSFTLAFLEKDEYELHFAGYEDGDNDGRLELKGMLEVSSIASLDLLGIQLDAATDVLVDVTVLGVHPG